jgi:uncharacterized protein HemY
VLVHETVQAGEVILVVDYLRLGVFVGRELDEVQGLLLTELDARGLEVSLHLLYLDVALSLGV